MECYTQCCKQLASLYQVKVDQLTTEMITRRLTELHQAGYSGQTIKVTLICIRMTLDWAALHYPGLESNPADKATLPRRLRAKKRDAPDKETTARIIQAKDSYFGMFFFFLFFTGMRRGEALGLLWDNVDLEGNVIKIEQQITHTKGKAMLAPLKTESSYRVIPILPPLRGELEKIRPEEWKGCFVFGATTDPRNPMPEKTLRRKEMHYYKSNGFVTIEEVEKAKQNGETYTYNKYHPTMTPHMMRHCTATLAYEAGVDAMTTAALLGHSDVKITQGIYTTLRERNINNELQKLADYINTNYTDKAH